MEQQGDPISQPTISTQTDDTANTGQGRHPLAEKKPFRPFADIDYGNSPDYLKHLCKVFGENFIAEATKSDPQSKNLLKRSNKKIGTT